MQHLPGTFNVLVKCDVGTWLFPLSSLSSEFFLILSFPLFLPTFFFPLFFLSSPLSRKSPKHEKYISFKIY